MDYDNVDLANILVSPGDCDAGEWRILMPAIEHAQRSQ